MPHPILKRAHSAHAPPAPPSHPSVHFPPSPSLTRTFSAHSSAQYDRTPIEVSPNACALPARGCPGRTYYDGAKPTRSGSSPKHLRPGKTLHPRAFAAYEMRIDEDDEEDEGEDELQRTPTRTSPHIPLPVPPPIPEPRYSNSPYSHSHSPSPYSLSTSNPHYPTYLPQSAPAHSYPSNLIPPPLVPDLSSSSDESDGFASPPPEPAAGFYVVGGSGKYPHPSLGYPNVPLYTPPVSHPFSYPSPQPPAYVPPAVLQDRKRRSRKSPPRQPVVEDGYEEEDLPGSFSHAGAFTARGSSSPPRERAPKKSSKEGRSRKDKEKERCNVGSLCRSLAGTSFRDADNEGCLGGF